MLRSAVFLAFALLPVAVLEAQSSPIPVADYTVSHTFRLGGNAPWDALSLDRSGGRLFVSRTDHVDVIDTATGKQTATIGRTAGVHGVAFAPPVNRGFTSNGLSNSVSVFELDSLRVVQEVTLPGQHPDAILYEPQHNLVITANRDSSDLTVIDAGALRVVSTIPLPGHPESLISDGAGHVYVNINEAPGKLVLVDAKTLTVKRKWPLKDCANPTGIAIDTAEHRVFSVCANQSMAVTDSVTGKTVARIVIGRGADSVGYDPDFQMLFTSNGIDGNLTVIHQDSPDDYRVLATVTTQVSARTLVLDPGSHRIYLAAARFGPPPTQGPEQPAPHANLIPDTFVILVAQPK